MGKVAERSQGGLNSLRHSFGGEQEISHQCHQADEVKEGEHDMKWWSFHANKLIPRFG